MLKLEEGIAKIGADGVDQHWYFYQPSSYTYTDGLERIGDF
jgi:phage terminase large subunit-like protein